MFIYIRLYAVFIAVSYTLFTAILQSIFLFLHFSIYCNMRLVQFDIYFSDLPCDLPCAASLAGIQPVRPRAQRTSP